MNSKVIVLVTFIVVVFSLIAGTAYKVYQIHQKRSYMVVEKRIVEGAIACIHDSVCKDEDMSLDKGYAKEELNPQTKLYYSRDSLIKKENQTFVFYGV